MVVASSQGVDVAVPLGIPGVRRGDGGGRRRRRRRGGLPRPRQSARCAGSAIGATASICGTGRCSSCSRRPGLAVPDSVMATAAFDAAASDSSPSLLADLSFRFVESPIRAVRPRLRWRTPAVAAVALGVMAMLALTVVPAPVATSDAASVVRLPPVAPSEGRASVPGTDARPDCRRRRRPCPLRPQPSQSSRRQSSEPIGDGGDGAVGAADRDAGRGPAAACSRRRRQHGAALVPGARGLRRDGSRTAARRQRCVSRVRTVGRLRRAAARVHQSPRRSRTDRPERLPGAVGGESPSASPTRRSTSCWSASGRGTSSTSIVGDDVVAVDDPVGQLLVDEAYRSFVDRVTAAGADVVWITPADTHLGGEPPTIRSTTPIGGRRCGRSSPGSASRRSTCPAG